MEWGSIGWDGEAGLDGQEGVGWNAWIELDGTEWDTIG